MSIIEANVTASENPLFAKMQAEIEALKAQNEKLRKAGQGKLTLKVSQAGAVSVYGMGRWPVTLYAGQWERLLEQAEQIKAFIAANAASLSRKE